jgi:hypothetical protein
VLGGDIYDTSLSTQPLQFTKIFDERSQEMTYNVIFTNNPNMSVSGYTVDREQVISENNLGVVQASESTNFNAYASKSSSLQSFLIGVINGEAAGFQARMLPYYPAIASLKQDSEIKNVSALGKKASYALTYTSDPTLINDGIHLSKTSNVQDNLPIKMHAPYLIIGRSKPLVHAPDQTELGSLSCSIATVLVRPSGYSPSSPFRPDSALNDLFIEALNIVLLKASDKAPTDTFATKVAYTYDSNLNAEATVEIQYLYPKETDM